MRVAKGPQGDGDVSKPYQPCEIDGKPCDWLAEEWYDDAGEMTAWDLYCQKCFRWCDWDEEDPPKESG
jgi:hypothetical protein